MVRKLNAKTERIVLTIENSLKEFINLISDSNPKSKNCKSKISLDLLNYGIMWMVECFPPVRNGNLDNFSSILNQIKREGTESISFQIKLKNIIEMNKEKLKGGFKDE